MRQFLALCIMSLLILAAGPPAMALDNYDAPATEQVVTDDLEAAKQVEVLLVQPYETFGISLQIPIMAAEEIPVWALPAVDPDYYEDLPTPPLLSVISYCINRYDSDAIRAYTEWSWTIGHWC